VALRTPFQVWCQRRNSKLLLSAGKPSGPPTSSRAETALSSLISTLSSSALLVAIGMGFLWLYVLCERVGLGDFLVLMLATPAFMLPTLLLLSLPSWLLYRRRRDRRDLRSLQVSLLAVAIVLGEATAVYVVSAWKHSALLNGTGG